MTGILAALREGRFICYGPAGVDDIDLSSTPDERDTRPPRGKFLETPRPRARFLPVPEIADNDPMLFRFFVDGSQRITNAGYIVDTKKRYLPLVIAQIGVATTELTDSYLRLKHYDSTNTLFFPDSFSDEDLADAETVACNAAKNSRLSIDLTFDRYEVDDTDTTPPVDRARARVLRKMHMMEVERIASLAKADEISRDALLLIDGSIDFYVDRDRHKEAFRNVVGVAKSFDLHRPYVSGSAAERVGTLISRLPTAHRTPARGAPHRNLTIASWYLRLYGRNRMASLEYPDGVVKIEVFPDDPAHDSPTIDAARCARISEHLLALRAPATPSTDTRWASHLYPVHLTERYIKTQFRNDRTIRACL